MTATWKRHLVWALAILGDSLAGQGAVYSPSAVYANSEGAGASYLFGSYSAARHQIADANQRGKSMVLTGLGLRLDHRNYDISDGMGRAWKDVSLRLSQCDLQAFGPTFSANATSTPQQIFNGSLRWPIQLDVPDLTPAAWSLTIPFSAGYAYAGNADLLMDFVFDGGVLDNNLSWTGTDIRPYALDSFEVGQTAWGPMARLGKANGGCVDSATGSAAGATLELAVNTYGAQHPLVFLRDRYHVEVVGRHFAPSASVLMVLSLRPIRAGISYPGVSCNQLHFDPTRSWYLYPAVSNAVGGIPAFGFGIPQGLIHYSSQWHGVSLGVQAVWSDSVSSALKFSAGARNSFVAPAFGVPNDVRMATFFDWNPRSRTARNMGVGDKTGTPIFRYQY